MKKFWCKLFVACLPMYVYVVIFITFEPYNYWGINAANCPDATVPLAVMRNFVRNPSENIILGDSRMVSFDIDYIEQLTGEEYVCLATGGQVVSQTREVYDWLTKYVTPQNVIMDVSFWQVMDWKFEGYDTVFYVSEHPLEYMVTRDYVIDMLRNMKRVLLNKDDIKPYESSVEHAGVTGKYDKKFMVYLEDMIYPFCLDYEISKESMDTIKYIIRQVNEEGGEITLIAPPVHESIWEYVITPLSLTDDITSYKNELSKYACIYDFEWESELSKEQNYFSDGFHFGKSEAYKIYTDSIFAGKGDFMRVWGEPNVLE